jgi:hypothetical protein
LRKAIAGPIVRAPQANVMLSALHQAAQLRDFQMFNRLSPRNVNVSEEAASNISRHICTP